MFLVTISKDSGVAATLSAVNEYGLVEFVLFCGIAKIGF